MKTMRPSHAILPDRIETRWILPTASYAAVRALLRNQFQPIIYSDRPWVQSILFNNDAHDMPPDIGIKLRRYFRHPMPGAYRPVPGRWLFERIVVDTALPHGRKKSRTNMDYRDAVRRFRRTDALCELSGDSRLCPLNMPLRPYIAIEYHREHFVARDHEDACRITLDRDTRFWHQHADGTWIPLGQEYGIRLEIKCLPAVLSSSLWRTLRTFLIRTRALPIGGKRYAALNRLSAWQRTLVPLPVNEVPGVAYRVSFDVQDAAAHSLSAELYQHFVRNRQFTIKADRPWIAEGGLIRVYFQDNFRINLYGDTFRWIWASPQQVRTAAGLIRRRRQEKSDHRLITPSQIEEMFSTHLFSGALLQGRRQFWIEDRDHRVFQISVFRSTNFQTRHHLTQLDLRYIGRSIPADPNHPSKKIESQLRMLAKQVKSCCKGLTPARRSLSACAAMQASMTHDPIAQVLTRIGTRTPRSRATFMQ